MSNPPLGNRDLMRSINRSAILNAIKNRRPIGRADIARLTGLSPATVTGITGDLLAEGLILEKSPGNSSGGRPPILLDLNPRGGFVVGIKLMEDHAQGAMTDLEAAVLTQRTVNLPDQSPKSAVDAMAELVEALLAAEKISHARLLGVGVGLAGIVDFERGVLRRSPFFGWQDLPLRELLQARLQAPVSIDNDVNTLTLAEMWFGRGRNQRHFLTLTVGRGIGLGLVLNGQLYRGTGGGAGEFGHTIIDPHGPPCECGQRGCLETYVSDPALLRQATQAVEDGALPPCENPAELARLAQAGYPAARAILAQAGEILGLAVANLVNLTNPHCLLISGEGVRYGEWMFTPLRASLNKHVQPPLLADLEICIEPWGDDMWAARRRQPGAAGIV